jgi:hypothetical protein
MKKKTPNIPLAVEALADWRKGKLSDGAALQAISLCLEPQPKPSAKVIAVAKKLAEKDAAKARPRRATKTKGSLPNSSDGKYILRLWDMFDGWLDIASNLTAEQAIARWEQETKGGTERVCYADGDYWDIFPSGTRMFVTPQSLGR